MSSNVNLFLCGDVMTGRGIDQILPHPSSPEIYEPYMSSALEYVQLAQKISGNIAKPAAYDYIWGDALKEFSKTKPDAKIINLETAVTKSSAYLQDKGINYRMNPENIRVLTSAKIDCCCLANNHVLDWGYDGLKDTVDTLSGAGIKNCGAGQDIKAAQKPAVIDIENKGRILVFAYCDESAGVPPSWAAQRSKPGVNLLEDFSGPAVDRIKENIKTAKKENDIAVFSMHWGQNWGYQVDRTQSGFAQTLIDRCGVDVVYGHSSHHPKGIQVHNGRLIIYGCGDFIDDYEGIGGYENFRPDLALMYFAEIDPASGRLVKLRIVPMRIKHFSVNRASAADALWLKDALSRQCEKFGTDITAENDGTFTLKY